MPITSLQDALKTLAQSLQLSTVLPSLMFVLIQILVVAPKFWTKVEWELTNVQVVILISAVTIVISYLLYAYNNPLIRLAEGYIGLKTPWMNALRAEHIERHQKLNKIFQDKLSLGSMVNLRMKLDPKGMLIINLISPNFNIFSTGN